MSEGTKPENKIVIVSGQEWFVPVGATEAELRQHLAATFPDVASATVQKSKRTIEGVEHEVWEFVKRAGTKGAGEAEPSAGGSVDLLELVADIPPLWDGVLAPAALTLVRRFLDGRLTIGEALDLRLADMIQSVPDSGYRTSGSTLCAQLDRLTPAPGTSELGW